MIKKHKIDGFTLIEIIAVLIILGILAAVATPKFMNMQRQARIAKLQEIKSLVIFTTNMLHAKAELLNLPILAEESRLQRIEPSNPEHNAQDFRSSVRLRFGYPDCMEDIGWAIDAKYGHGEVNICLSEILIDWDRPNCAVKYKNDWQNNPGSFPKIWIVDDDC